MEKTGQAAQDYFDDNPIDAIESDKLGHKAVADEVSHLVQAADATTIGLFGGWGTGKSSVLGLLKSSLDELEVEPVTFDAWKYSDEPLRRQLLVTIAAAVAPGEVTALKQRLYESTEEPIAPTIKGAGQKALLAGAVLLCSAAVLIAAANTAKVLQQGRWDIGKFLGLTLTSLSTGLAPFAVLSVAIGTAFEIYKALPWGKVSRPPVADERLDDELQKLLGAAGAQAKFNPLVVIVDELDRCRAERVADALELTRQFLSVPGCVTVIAADREYLSRAWYAALELKQDERPRDFDEYLDKVFKRQVHLPPVHPAKLSKLALDLVTDRGGVWQQCPDTERVVSTLIPTSVTTPRRVKALLNNFVTQYHVAERRFHLAGRGSYVSDRLVEFAKICTIKLEFPRFYRQLVAAHRAAGLADSVLAHGGLNETDRSESAHYPGLTTFLQELADAQQEVRKGTEPPEDPRAAEMQSLVRYLDRTAGVPTGSHDLLFLEIPHNTFGLDPSLAEEILSYAVDDQPDAITERLHGESEDIARAIRYVVSRLSEAIGVERANACKTALLLAGDTRISLNPLDCRALLSELPRLHAESRLTPYTAPGRIRCAVALGETNAACMVIKEREVRQENDARLDAEIMAAAYELAGAGPVADAGLDYFLSTGLGALEYLAGESESAATRVVEGLMSRDLLVKRLRVENPAEPGGALVEAPVLGEYRALLRMSPESFAWNLARAAVALRSDSLVREWQQRYNAVPILPGEGATFAGMLALRDEPSRRDLGEWISRGISDPSDFDAIATVLCDEQGLTEGGEHLWSVLVDSIGFDADDPTAERAVAGISERWNPEEPAPAARLFRRMTAVAKRVPSDEIVSRLFDRILEVCKLVEEEDDDWWALVVDVAGDEDLQRLLDQERIVSVAKAILAISEVEIEIRASLALQIVAPWEVRPPFVSAEVKRLASSPSERDQDTLRRFLGLPVSLADLSHVADAKRSMGSDDFGSIAVAYQEAVSRLNASDAVSLMEQLLSHSWPKKRGMVIYGANTTARVKVAEQVVTRFLDSRQRRPRRYAIQVLEALAPLPEKPAVRLARGTAKAIRSGGAEYAKFVAPFIGVFAEASSSSRDDLRQALKGAMKRATSTTDARLIRGAADALTVRASASEDTA